MDNGPIFIVGAPRSGTTLLQFMLRSHPHLWFPSGESHFFVPLYRSRDGFGDLSTVDGVRAVLGEIQKYGARNPDSALNDYPFDADSVAAEFVSEGRNSIPLIIAGLFQRNARAEGKSRWGDKTPYYVLHMPLLREMFPDAQFVHIVRDGRDCAMSMLERGDEFSIHNHYHAAKVWQHYVDTGQQLGATLPAGAYLEIRYEDLLENPETVIHRVCGFLGEPYDESVVNFRKAKQAGKTPLLQKPIQKGNQQKWLTAMTPLQIRMFESGAGDTLRRCGYSLQTAGTPFPKLVRGALRLHNSWMAWLSSRKGKAST